MQPWAGANRVVRAVLAQGPRSNRAVGWGGGRGLGPEAQEGMADRDHVISDWGFFFVIQC